MESNHVLGRQPGHVLRPGLERFAFFFDELVKIVGLAQSAADRMTYHLLSSVPADTESG